MGKFEQYGQAAENLYLSGKTITEIASMIPVARKTIGDWCSKGGWERKRKTRATSAGEIAEFTLDVLRAKLQELRDLPPSEVSPGAIDGLFKLLLVAERVAKESRLLEKAVLVMDAYVDHCRTTLAPDEMEQEFVRINHFLSSLEGSR